MAKFAYSNNGQSFRMVEPDWGLNAGEVLFATPPTADQLTAAFPGYAQQVALAALASIAEVHLGANLSITSVVTGSTVVNSYAPQYFGIITGAYQAALVSPSFAVSWQDQTGAFYSLSAAQVISMWEIGMTYVQAVYAQLHTLTDQVMAATTPDAVAAISLSAGWPATSY